MRISYPKASGESELPFSNYVYMWAFPISAVFEARLRGEGIDAGALEDNYGKRGVICLV